MGNLATCGSGLCVGTTSYVRAFQELGLSDERSYFGSGASSGSAPQLSSPPTSYRYAYDKAGNLVEIGCQSRCSDRTANLPSDLRNRPQSLGVTDLEWDEEDRLVRKGEQRYRYDAHSRLTQVLDSSTGAEIASYTYDVLNRRITRTVGAETYRTVWDGWKAIEEYRVTGGANELISRRTYGPGLDEILMLEQKPPGGVRSRDLLPGV